MTTFRFPLALWNPLFIVVAGLNRKSSSSLATPPKPQILPLVRRDADLLVAATAPVVPEHPALAVDERSRGLVDGVMVPAIRRRADDGVGGVALPGDDAVAGTGQTDL